MIFSLDNKMVRKATKKKTIKASVAKATILPLQEQKESKKKNEAILPVCIQCHSHHLEKQETSEGTIYTCLRCGRSSPYNTQKSIGEAQTLLKNRKQHTIFSYHTYRKHHHYQLKNIVQKFHLRAMFTIISTVLLSLSVILLPSSAWDSGLLFLIIGIVGLYTSITWF
jgi:hypothetical protein